MLVLGGYIFSQNYLLPEHQGHTEHHGYVYYRGVFHN